MQAAAENAHNDVEPVAALYEEPLVGYRQGALPLERQTALLKLPAYA
jgi:hypothetical protein